MKIIKRNEPKEKEIKKTCSDCKSKFSYVKYDIEYDPQGGDGYVNCPVCKAFVWVYNAPNVNRMDD